MTRYRLEINPSDSAETRIVRDDKNGSDMLIVLSEKVDYSLKRARDYHDEAEQAIVEMKDELVRRRTARGKDGNA